MPAASVGVVEAEEISVSLCIVTLIDDVTIAAQEDGVLSEISLREGAAIRAGQRLAQIDDREAIVQRGISESQREIALKKASNDVDVRYALAEARVKQFEHDRARDANRMVSDVVGQVELKRLALAHEEAVLKAEKASRDLGVLVLEADVRRLELDGAKLGVERRSVVSPIDGVLVQRLVDVGEWVKAGDPICRVIRLDRLWVEGMLEASRYGPGDAAEKSVSVRVSTTRDRSESFRGKVVFVDPQVDGNGRFRVRAEVENRNLGKHWLLMPGHVAEMTVTDAPPP